MMESSRDSFFHDATIQICSTLDLENMLQNSFDFLGKFIPIDAIGLSVYEMKMHSVRRFSLYGKNGIIEGESLELLPAEGHNHAMSLFRQNVSVVLTNKIEENPIRLYLNQCGRSKYESALVLHLHFDNKFIGMVDIFCKEREAFTQKDAELLSQLNIPFSLFMVNFLKFREQQERERSIVKENFNFRKQVLSLPHNAIIVGSSPEIQEVIQKADDVSNTTTPVLLTGETGVGKDVFARYIQEQSDRYNKPFIKINCAAVPENLLENEFFGHEAQAFTGASCVKKGKFECADHGTIFLDEIGELSPGAQAKLLRVLENKEIERIGGTKSISVDVRIIAATNQALESLMRQGLFRRDLFYRLNVFPIQIPPLRDRKKDIRELVLSMIQKFTGDYSVKWDISPEEWQKLMAYDWPGNVRELANVVERAMVHLKKKKKIVFDIDPASTKNFGKQKHVDGYSSEYDNQLNAEERKKYLTLEELERRYISFILKKSNGKIMGKNGAAEILNINGHTLRKRMEKLGVKFKKKDRPELP